MRILRNILIVLSIIIALAIMFLLLSPGRPIMIEPNSFFTSDHIKKVSRNNYSKERVYIEMSDGTKIAANCFLPKNLNIKLPTLFMFGPYNRALIVKNLSLKQKIGSQYYLGHSGPVYDMINRDRLHAFIEHGYAIVFADIRGTGASFGNYCQLCPQIVDDGVEILKWIEDQEWSDGKIGMMDQSYLGWTQLAIAARNPSQLKCISPGMIGFDSYSEFTNPGGIKAIRWISGYDQVLRRFNMNSSYQEDESSVFPGEPVIDEDGDGKYFDEIPDYEPGNPNIFTDVTPVTYSDKSSRTENVFYELTMEHKNNIWPDSMSRMFQYYNDKIAVLGDTIDIEDTSPAFFVNKIRKTKIPMFLYGGWFDGWTKGITQIFSNVQSTNPSYLFLTPRFHMPHNIIKPYADLFGMEDTAEDDLLSLQLAFFDKYLKGNTNNILPEEKVIINTLFKGYETFQKWPPNSVNTTYFFNEKNTLDLKIDGQVNSANYDVDFTHESSYGPNNYNRWLLNKRSNTVMYRTEADKKSYLLETAPFSSKIQVTGHPIATIFMSCNQKNTDLFLYLSDVDEEGNSIYITEGQLRTSFAKLISNDTMVHGQYDVKPELPWHGYRKEDIDTETFTDGKIVKLVIDLQPISWLFQEGHKMRLSISGADYPNFELNKNCCPDLTIESCRKTSFTIHSGGEVASMLEVPVISSND